MIETPINAHFYMIGWLWVITCIGRETQNIETKVKSLRSPIHDLRSAGFCVHVKCWKSQGKCLIKPLIE